MKVGVVAIDIGYSNTKLAYGDALVPEVEIIPSGVCAADSIGDRVIGSGKSQTHKNLVVTVGDNQFAVGIEQTQIKQKRQRNPNYPFTDQYLALFYGGLSLTRASEVDTLVTGLPVEQYQDASTASRLEARLRGEHEVSPGHVVSVRDVYVTAQPVGAFVDMHFQGAQRNYREIMSRGRVLVLDPGFHTVDWAFFDQGSLLKTVSGSNTAAMSSVMELVSVCIEHDLGDKVTIERIEQAMRSDSNSILFHGEELNISNYLETALDAVNTDAITDLLNAKNLDREQIDLVVLAGGGAGYYRKAAEKVFPGSRIEISSSPVAANVRGYWYMERARCVAADSAVSAQVR